MTQAEQNALVDVSDIEKYFLGSPLSGGSSDPKAGNSLDAWTDMYDGYQQRALKTRLGIPILLASMRSMDITTCWGPSSSRITSACGCTRNPALGRKGGAHHGGRSSGHRTSIGVLLLASRFLATSDGAGLTKGLAKHLSWPRVLAPPPVRGLQRNDLGNPSAVLSLCETLYW